MQPNGPAAPALPTSHRRYIAAAADAGTAPIAAAPAPLPLPLSRLGALLTDAARCACNLCADLEDFLPPKQAEEAFRWVWVERVP